MADVSITLKVSAHEFQTLREELRAAAATLLSGANQAKAACNHSDARDLRERAAQVSNLLEKLG